MADVEDPNSKNDANIVCGSDVATCGLGGTPPVAVTKDSTASQQSQPQPQPQQSKQQQGQKNDQPQVWLNAGV